MPHFMEDLKVVEKGITYKKFYLFQKVAVFFQLSNELSNTEHVKPKNNLFDLCLRLLISTERHRLSFFV
jgi:hypothetical protein